MAKKLSSLIAIILTFSFLFTSIVYACSGLDSMLMVSHEASTDREARDMGPCSEQKPEICKSLRDQFLSIRDSSSSKAAILVYDSTVLEEVSTEIPLTSELSLLSRSLPIGFHPFFKLPLIYSYLVLRI